jgi:O-antigen/teichoic acid export membrane protein
LRYAALLAIPLIGINVFALKLLLPTTAGMWQEFSDAALVAIGSAAMIGYTMQRAILLTRTDGDVFSAVTAAPSFMFLVLLPLSVLIGIAPIASAYFIVGLASIALTHILLTLKFPTVSNEAARDIDWRMVLSQSGHMLLQSVAYGLQPLITVALLQRHSNGSVLAGLFNIAALVFILPNLLMAMVAPVFYNRWSKLLDHAGLKTIATKAAMIAGGLQVLALMAWPLAEPAAALVFGEGFRQAAPAIQIMALGAAPLAFTRILSPAFQGLGSMETLTLSCFLRLVPIGVLAVIQPADPLAAASIAWVAGEYLAAIVVLAGLRRTMVSSRRSA